MMQDGLTLPIQSPPAVPRGESNPEPAPRSAAKAFGKALAKAAKQGKQDETDAALLGSASSRDAASAALGSTLHGGPDLGAAAHLDRIASAIAEVAASGADARVQLTLPPGALPVQGAILGRDTGGALTVMLLAQGQLAPAVSAGLANDLSQRLLRRQVKVARVTFEKASSRPASAG